MWGILQETELNMEVWVVVLRLHQPSINFYLITMPRIFWKSPRHNTERQWDWGGQRHLHFLRKTKTKKKQQNNYKWRQRFGTRILHKRSLGTEWQSAFPLTNSCCVQEKSFSIFLNCMILRKKNPLGILSKTRKNLCNHKHWNENVRFCNLFLKSTILGDNPFYTMHTISLQSKVFKFINSFGSKIPCAGIWQKTNVLH